MGQVEFVLNQLGSRDPELAARFEREIEEAVAALGTLRLRCRILAWQRGLDVGARDRVTVLLHATGWVKAFGVSVHAAPGEVRAAVLRALVARPRSRAASAATPVAV
jgi:hypothetical protein